MAILHDRILEDHEAAVADEPEYVVEDLVADVATEAYELLQSRNWNQTRLAAELGVSRSRVSTMLTGSPNMTMITVVRLSMAFGLRPIVHLDGSMCQPLSVSDGEEHEAAVTGGLYSGMVDNDYGMIRRGIGTSAAG